MTNNMHETIKVVPTKELLPDKEQPRQDFDIVKMKQLQESIIDKGIMTPITVEPKKDDKYLIVDGERRYRCSLAIGLKNVPVNVLDKELTIEERNIIRFQLQETHSQWTVFEKAEALSNIKRELGLTVAELARALAISTATTQRYLALLNFPIGTRRKFVEAKMPFIHLESLTHTKNLMPESLKRKYPDFIETFIEKYNKGVVTYSKDWKKINKLAKANKTKYLEKFITIFNYSANDAYYDAGLETDDIDASIRNKAIALYKTINIAVEDKVDISSATNDALAKLDESLNKIGSINNTLF